MTTHRKRRPPKGSVKASVPYRYPLAVRSVSHLYGEPGTSVWLTKGGGVGDFFSLAWSQRTKTVTVKRMTVKGDYWFNNGDNSQHGTPDTYEVVTTAYAETPREARAWMDRYAQETYNIADWR